MLNIGLAGFHMENSSFLFVLFFELKIFCNDLKFLNILSVRLKSYPERIFSCPNLALSLLWDLQNKKHKGISQFSCKVGHPDLLVCRQGHHFSKKFHS